MSTSPVLKLSLCPCLNGLTSTATRLLPTASGSAIVRRGQSVLGTFHVRHLRLLRVHYASWQAASRPRTCYARTRTHACLSSQTSRCLDAARHVRIYNNVTLIALQRKRRDVRQRVSERCRYCCCDWRTKGARMRTFHVINRCEHVRLSIRTPHTHTHTASCRRPQIDCF